jgi:hypothetical protein
VRSYTTHVTAVAVKAEKIESVLNATVQMVIKRKQNIVNLSNIDVGAEILITVSGYYLFRSAVRSVFFSHKAAIFNIYA